MMSGGVGWWLAGAALILAGCAGSAASGVDEPVAVVVSDGELNSREVDEQPNRVDEVSEESTTVVEKSVESEQSESTTTTDGLRILEIEYTVEDGVISGQVLDQGEPVSNVDVRLKDADTEEEYQVRGTDLDGRYKFGPLDPACYKTKAVAPEGARWETRYNSPRYAYDYMCIE